MEMILEREDVVVPDSERPVDCEQLRRMGLAELLYHALVEWGGGYERAMA